MLLNYLMDPRTGLGRFRDFTISNYQLMMNLIDACLTLSIDEILQLPDVRERVDLYNAHQAEARAQLVACSTVHANSTPPRLKVTMSPGSTVWEAFTRSPFM